MSHVSVKLMATENRKTKQRPLDINVILQLVQTEVSYFCTIVLVTVPLQRNTLLRIIFGTL